MNTGIRAASEVIVRIDGHSIPKPDYIRRAVAHLQEPKAGVVGGVWEIVPGANTPIVTDDEWNTASSFPLARVIADIGPDPWGNAYLVNLADRRNGWVIPQAATASSRPRSPPPRTTRRRRSSRTHPLKAPR